MPQFPTVPQLVLPFPRPLCPQCGERPLPKRSSKYCGRACMSAAMRIPLEVQFWSRVRITPGCWIWTGTKNPHGYGVVSTPEPGRRTLTAPRISWELNVGPIPKGQCVLHRCDRPACVNPEHLFLGTRADNVIDMDRKGRRRAAKGVINHRAKLTDAEVLDLRRRHAAGGICFNAEGERLGVSGTTIAYAVHGKTWRHL